MKTDLPVYITLSEDSLKTPQKRKKSGFEFLVAYTPQSVCKIPHQ